MLPFDFVQATLHPSSRAREGARDRSLRTVDVITKIVPRELVNDAFARG